MIYRHSRRESWQLPPKADHRSSTRTALTSKNTAA